MAKGDGKPTRHRVRYTSTAEYRRMNDELLPAVKEKLGDKFAEWWEYRQNASEMRKHLDMVWVLEGLGQGVRDE